MFLEGRLWSIWGREGGGGGEMGRCEKMEDEEEERVCCQSFSTSEKKNISSPGVPVLS